MWQCLPINKVGARIVLFTLLNALVSSHYSGALAQANLGTNSIVSIKEDRKGSSVTLQTGNPRKLPRPIIQFLQGENGDTVLVADFPGVVFPFSTKVFAVNAAPLAARTGTAGSAERRGIKLVRIGCYQESPPICRIAVVANDAAKLRTVSFNTAPGSLTMKWSKSARIETGQHAASNAAAGARHEAAGSALASSKRTGGNYHPIATVPPFAPPVASLDPGVASSGSVVNPAHLDPEVAASYYPLRPPIAESWQLGQSDRNSANVTRRTPERGQLTNAPFSENSAPALHKSPTTSTSTLAGKANLSPRREGIASPAVADARAPSPGKAPPVMPYQQPDNKRAAQPPANERAGEDLAPKPAPDRHKTVASGQADGEPTQKQTDHHRSGSGLIRSFLAKFKGRDPANPAPDRESAAAAGIESGSQTGTSTPFIADRSSPGNSASAGASIGNSNHAPAKPSGIQAFLNKLVDHKDEQSAEKPSDVADKEAIQFEQMLTITLTATGRNGYILKIASADRGELNFSSFRLHNPERFVIDFENLRSIQASVVPQPENLDVLKAVRVGTPDPLKNTGRLVLDLAAENISVIPSESEGVNVVALAIGETANVLTDLNAPAGSTIVLDAGHGGSDPGAQRGYLKEKDLTLAIAEKTYQLLTSHGVKVVLTRKDDTFIPLAERVSVTNNYKPDAFLSIHINSLESTSEIHGIETYYQTDMSHALAQSIHESLVNELEAPDRSVRKARFYVINRAEVPAVLAEVGFISNKTEREKLGSSDYQEKIAGALAKGAILYLKQHSAVAKKHTKISSGPVEKSIRSGFKTISNGGGGRISSASRLAQKGLGIKRNE